LAPVAKFEVGRTVVFGSEGFARIEAYQERDLLGETVKVVDLFVLDTNMKVSVPLDRAVERGLRPIVTRKAADAALAELGEVRGEPLPWNRDGRILKDRFAEGGVDAMVEVLASIEDTAQTRKLNDGQRTLQERVRKALTRELAAALDLDDEAVGERIDAALARRHGD
jgi:CarD family transcriptional regulator